MTLIVPIATGLAAYRGWSQTSSESDCVLARVKQSWRGEARRSRAPAPVASAEWMEVSVEACREHLQRVLVGSSRVLRDFRWSAGVVTTMLGCSASNFRQMHKLLGWACDCMVRPDLS
jgi:hypothetical protein